MPTTRAPASSASRWLPSVLPLSATTTSPFIPLSAMNFTALWTQTATVSASLRHGMTTVSSTWTPCCLRDFLTKLPASIAVRRTGLPITLYNGRLADSACLAQGGYGLEGSTCGHSARGGQQQTVRHRARAGRPAPDRRRARVSLAVLVQRLVEIRRHRNHPEPGPDQALWLLAVPVAAQALPQLRAGHGLTAPDGPACGGDDLRPGEAPVRGAGVGRGARRAARAL